MAAVTVFNVTGTFENGEAITITASGQGSKTTAKPRLWADFETDVQPTSLGSDTEWDLVQNMSHTASAGFNGTGGAVGLAGNGFWTLRTDITSPFWLDDGQTAYIFRRTKKNFLITTQSQNYKNWRVWQDPDVGGKPNFYFAANNGRCYGEYMGQESGFWAALDGFNPSSIDWVAEEIITKGSSSAGTKDGSLKYRVDGIQKASGSLLTHTASVESDVRANYVFHEVVANTGGWSPAWSSSNNVWGDEIYVDTTWQRVMIGDASTLANSRKFNMVIPSAWSTSSVTGKLTTTAFSDGEKAYVYVFDATNTPNTTGYEITISGTVAGDPPPTVESVNVSTGAYEGGTASTATCTGLSATVTVNVGTMTATNVVRQSATSVSFTIPPGPQGETGLDLKVTNSDGQFAVLTATMSYTSPAVATNQAPFDVRAGDDWELTLPNTTLLSGAASDDGLPADPGTLSYLWQKKSGPGTVTFTDSTSLQTSASFSEAGTYTVSLTASDGELDTESEAVNVIVNAAPGIAFPWVNP